MMPTTGCQSGTAVAAMRVTIDVGAVSGKRLSTVAMTPFGSFINTELNQSGTNSGSRIANVNCEPSRMVGASAPSAPSIAA